MTDVAAVAREYTESWNRRDFARMRELLAEDYTYTGGDGHTQPGADAGLAVAEMFATAFPDGRIDIQRIHVTGDVAIVEFIGRGTQTGPLLDIAATERQVTVPVCNVLEIRDGKIRNEREYMDMLTILQQLGVAPAPAAV